MLRTIDFSTRPTVDSLPSCVAAHDPDCASGHLHHVSAWEGPRAPTAPDAAECDAASPRHDATAPHGKPRRPRLVALSAGAALVVAGLLHSAVPSAAAFLHVDQFGYRPQATKVAVLGDPQVGFNAGESYAAPATVQVRRASDDAIVLVVNTVLHEGGAIDPASGDRGWWADFSSLTTPGSYYLYDAIGDERSPVFVVADDVYREVLVAACRMFYYNRCGTAKPESYAGADWSDSFCFSQDAATRDIAHPNDPARYKDLSGGWFDAGDYNKYVTFADRAVHDLLAAYEENPLVFGDDFGIPESGNGVPDLLDELRWELDWLARMTNPDGSTHLKMGSRNYSENTLSPPSANTDPRYYGPVCTSASVSLAGMFAHAALVYGQIPGLAAYATSLGVHAEAAWNWALPYFTSGTLQTGCDDGSIVAGDADWSVAEQEQAFVTAAVHLFALTGDPAYDAFVTQHYASTEPISQSFWGPYFMPLNDALLRYAALPDADPTVSATIRASLAADRQNNWSGYYGFDGRDLYRAFMPDWSYHWGSNLPRTHYGNLNRQVTRFGIAGSDPEAEALIAAEHLHWIHGANPLGLCYLSNMYALGADHCLNQIYHTWFAHGTIWDHALESERGPAPGYVSGGPNAQFSVPEIQPPAGQPLQKSYLDFNDGWPTNSWEVSEPAIYSQAGYIRLLAGEVSLDTTDAPNPPLAGTEMLRVVPNPGRGIFQLRGAPEGVAARLYAVDGRLVRELRAAEIGSGTIDLGAVPPGLYLLEAGDRSARVIVRR